MSFATEKRSLDPEQIHHVWLALINLLKQLSTSTNESAAPPASAALKLLCAQIKTESSNKNAAESIVQQAIKEGLLVLSKPSESTNYDSLGTNGADEVTAAASDPLVSLPIDSAPKGPKNGFSKHDWYCFGCQLASGKSLLECNNCWRVYHSACVQPHYEFAVKLSSTNSDSTVNRRNFTCPICTLSQKFAPYSVGSRLFSQVEFNQILSYTYQAFKLKSSQISRNLLKLKDSHNQSLSASSLSSVIGESFSSAASASSSAASSPLCELTTQLALQYLSYQPIDLNDIESKLEQSGYTSLGELLGDCLAVKHTIEVTVVAGTESDNSRRRIRDTLNRMLEACRYDLKEMLGCIDCYRNSNSYLTDKLWFARLCRPPHMLVFAKQKGYPFWPAKVINPRNAADRESCTEFDVRFFGAQHERFVTDHSNIKDINSSLSELAINKANISLEKALAELRIHRDLLEKFEQGNIESTMTTNEHDDGLKIKRKYNRRPSTASRKRSDSVSSSSSNIKRKVKVEEEVALGRGKRKRPKVRSRSNTVESDATIADQNEEVDSKSAPMTESEHDSEDVYEDAKEEISEQDDDGGHDVATDIDEPEGNAEDKAPLASKSRRRTKARAPSIENDESKSGLDEATGTKRGRGRPRKYFPTSMEDTISSAVTPSTANRRIRKSKVLYSPQNYKATRAESVQFPVVVPKLPKLPEPISPPPTMGKTSTRGRRPKSRSNQSPSPLRVTSPTLGVSSAPKSSRIPGRRGRPPLSPRPRSKSPIHSPGRPERLSPANSKVARKLSLSPSPVRKSEKRVTERSERRKRNIERQRQLLRRRKQKVPLPPKHIPPVTATKSLPAFSVSPSPLNRSITPSSVRPLSKIPSLTPDLKPILSSNGTALPLSPLNGFSPINTPLFSFASQNGFLNQMLPTMPKFAAPATFPMQFPTRFSQFPPSQPSMAVVSAKATALSNELKPLPNGDLVNGTSSKLQNGQPLINGNENDGNLSNVDGEQLVSAAAEPNESNLANMEDNDDDEPYMYDDEQLEEQINEYVTYQEEKEQFEKQQLQWQLVQQQQQLYQQQQMLQQLQMQQRAVTTPNGFANRQPPPSLPLPQSPVRSKAFDTPPKKYLEYSSSCIYSPTKKNQNLVNNYLHQFGTANNNLPTSKNDYLAQLVLRKDDFDAEQQQAEAQAAKPKRGRPPKTVADEVAERSGKAKSIVEKSYLQESACDRACLMKNIKTFKRFRDFVEVQNKDDASKFKKEIEQLKQEVYRLKNQKEELESDLKRERDNSKRLDPQLMSQLVARHQRELSEVKQKQWCIACDAEASYFCCFNTNYCSPECQHKHWFAGHQHKCGRNRSSNKNSSDRSLVQPAIKMAANKS